MKPFTATDELLHVPSWSRINGAMVELAQMMERRSKFDALRDAADECEHGRLPGDRLDGKAPNWPHTHPCGCWPQEGPAPSAAPTPALMDDLTKEQRTMRFWIEDMTPNDDDGQFVDDPTGDRVDGHAVNRARERKTPQAITDPSDGGGVVAIAFPDGRVIER